MTTRSPVYFRAWNRKAERYLARRGISGSELARCLHVAQANVSAILIGKQRPPLDLVRDMARLLLLSAEERAEFEWLAHEAHTPPEVWARLQQLERLVSRGERELGALRTQLADLAQEVGCLRGERGDLAQDPALPLGQHGDGGDGVGPGTAESPR